MRPVASFLAGVALALCAAVALQPARAVSHTVPAATYSCVKWMLQWNANGTKTVTVGCNDGQGNLRYSVPFTLDATNVIDRFGTVVLAQPVSFQNAMTTIATQIDGALVTLEASGAFAPP